MGLREQAALDSQSILEDDSGFAWPFTLTSPLGVVSLLKGFTTDIGTTIDPETGVAVAGRKASVAVSLRTLTEPLNAVLVDGVLVGGPIVGVPVAVADRDKKPWVVTFANIAGVMSSFKIVEVLPDSAVGVVVLLLELYHASSN
jgi:hypothetical protein